MNQRTVVAIEELGIARASTLLARLLEDEVVYTIAGE
jgi:hypothetical protein